MLLIYLLLIPIFGASAIILIPGNIFYLPGQSVTCSKVIALSASVINMFLSLVVYILFNFSNIQFQFVQEYHRISNFDFYLGVDGISIYFVLLTAIIMPISLLSNWSSVSENVKSYLVIILLLETLLLAVFLLLDTLLFYIFFESILSPLFLLIGIFGSSNRVRASFYLFLYTLLGSLFLLLSILTISSIMGTTDFDALYKTNFNFYTQIFLFCGIFIAFAVKTPTIFLNTWLLKAHVESPLGGSIILAGIVLKLSLYGILRLILPLIPKASIYFTPLVYVIAVVTIIYASFSTLRTIDIKELIAYSSVSHAAVYLLGVFSNTVQGIEGGIVLGLAHGFVSSGLFICAGGVLYDRSSTRLIDFYRGIAQVMPIFSILFFILCLGNAGTPLSLNFIGEFMSLYGTFERLPLLGMLASSSIVFSAAYTIYMFNRIAFAGSFSVFFDFNIPDLSKREFSVLFILVMLTIILGIYPAPILDGLHFSVTSLIYSNYYFSGINVCGLLLLMIYIINILSNFYYTISKFHGGVEFIIRYYWSSFTVYDIAVVSFVLFIISSSWLFFVNYLCPFTEIMIIIQFSSIILLVACRVSIIFKTTLLGAILRICLLVLLLFVICYLVYHTFITCTSTSSLYDMVYMSSSDPGSNIGGGGSGGGEGPGNGPGGNNNNNNTHINGGSHNRDPEDDTPTTGRSNCLHESRTTVRGQYALFSHPDTICEVGGRYVNNTYVTHPAHGPNGPPTVCNNCSLIICANCSVDYGSYEEGVEVAATTSGSSATNDHSANNSSSATNGNSTSNGNHTSNGNSTNTQ